MGYIELEPGTREYRRVVKKELSDAPEDLLISEVEERGFTVTEGDDA